MVFCALVSEARAQIKADTVGYIYCEMVGSSRPGAKVSVLIAFGERLKDEQTGRIKSFKTMPEGLNYMARDGWELATAYIDTGLGGGKIYRWVLKKRRPLVTASDNRSQFRLYRVVL